MKDILFKTFTWKQLRYFIRGSLEGLLGLRILIQGGFSPKFIPLWNAEPGISDEVVGFFGP